MRDYLRGVPFNELAEKYKDQVSEKTIRTIAKDQKWDDIAQDISDNVKEKTQKGIEEAKVAVFETMIRAANVSTEIANDEIEDYLVRRSKSKKAKIPAFLAKNIRELEKVAEMLAGNWEKPEPSQFKQTNIYGKVNVNNTQNNLLSSASDDVTLDKLLLNLSQMTNDQVLSLNAPGTATSSESDEVVEDADFEEVIETEESETP